jgi:hypothetical protein
MLFRPRADGKDTLYIGPCDKNGLPSTETKPELSGLYFFDLDFENQPLKSS